MRGEGNKRVGEASAKDSSIERSNVGSIGELCFLMLICGFESLRIGHVNDDKQLAVFLLCGACFQPLSREQANIWWERERGSLGSRSA